MADRTFKRSTALRTGEVPVKFYEINPSSPPYTTGHFKACRPIQYYNQAAHSAGHSAGL